MSELNYTEKLEAKIEELERLSKQVREELERENSSLKEDVDLTQGEKTVLENKIEELENKIEDLEDKLSESYNLEKIEFELNRLDTYWKDRFDMYELQQIPSICQKIINIFLYG